ncbi:UvrD-helicase domain-containing protein [Acetobacter orientalis]|uniref:UvrD-helicase domain-containing protein n=1 Tax=Acetobacter orientalis TaxID=146474 RepID=UPI0020A26EE8|nr:UvrD-helicase domain-containing protein [Acetobacter orientalis]MCP1222470.1 UvrD-helicase domain-containing protein [Acetobacter orientalis]
MVEYTPQQRAILAKSPTASFKVVAGAGCGKTSTLVLYSAHWAGQRGLYLAFNAAIAREARSRFGRQVEARTAHSYAFADLGLRALEAGRLVPRYNLRHIRQLEAELGLKAPPGSAETVLKTLTAFLISAGTKLTQAHCPERDVKTNRAIRTFVATAFKHLIRFEKHAFPITHDVYLKRFEMERKITGYDYIMVDEAQDLNPVLLSILEKSGLPLVVVGDPYQSIYAFRGAVDAMSSLKVQALPLSRSWRFGENIARLANGILRTHASPPPYPLQGNPALQSTVRHYGGKIRPTSNTLVLARSNVRLFESLVNIKTPFHVLGGVQDMMQEIRSALTLYRRHANPAARGVENTLPFGTWKELVAAKEGENADPIAKRLFTIVDKHGYELAEKMETIQTLYRDTPDEVNLVCSTAHKAKGREFETVIMLDDFLSPVEWATRREKAIERMAALEDNAEFSEKYKLRQKEKQCQRIQECTQEINVLYVACTRAQKLLYVPDGLYTFWQEQC